MAEQTHSGWQHLKAILAPRCPRCCEGRLFRGLFAMHRCCPVCGLRFEREQGYFLGAMYVSYPLAIGLIGLFLWIATLLWPEGNLNWQIAVAAVAYLPFMPAVFRYSRVLWLHLDWWVSPSDASTGTAWEKWCQREEAKGRGLP